MPSLASGVAAGPALSSASADFLVCNRGSQDLSAQPSRGLDEARKCPCWRLMPRKFFVTGWQWLPFANVCLPSPNSKFLRRKVGATAQVNQCIQCTFVECICGVVHHARHCPGCWPHTANAALWGPRPPEENGDRTVPSGICLHGSTQDKRSGLGQASRLAAQAGPPWGLALWSRVDCGRALHQRVPVRASSLWRAGAKNSRPSHSLRCRSTRLRLPRAGRPLLAPPAGAEPCQLSARHQRGRRLCLRSAEPTLGRRCPRGRGSRGRCLNLALPLLSA